ncbi:MAG: hypothetical protein ACYSSI_05015 [Planctomycetota bacterium]|jgi:hypothetical protein
MENLKNRYEFILGFVGLAISLSIFKEELSKIDINLGFVQFPLLNYFFIVLVGLLICLYLYVIEKTFRNTKIGNCKIFDYLIKFAYFFFILLITSPVLLLLSWVSHKIILKFSNLDTKRLLTLSAAISSAFGLISGFFSSIIAHKQLSYKKDKQQEELEYEQIKELEIASSLLEKRYYSQSILETFKVLELHLYKLLQKEDIRVQRNRFIDILDFALKKEIINKDELNFINKFRAMRNSAAHLNIKHTEEEARKALDFVRHLIKKNS